MESFEWKEKFSVHVEEMDNHHKKLLGYFAELQKEIPSGNPSPKVGDTLNALLEYANFHFTEEERLMREINYPEIASQINQHAYFSNEVNGMKSQFNQGALLSQSVLAFLRDWFINHILQEDYKYGELIQQGRKSI